ncbi:MAG TPA: GntR family transcriptional regulator [Solirubrobacterales bacterium]|jgi:GntR family transcriptional regulator
MAAPPKPATAPAYVQIAGSLRDRIEGGELAPGAPLPGERELAGNFGVSRMTVRHALTVLEHEGLLVREPPRGTFVASPRLQLRIGSFSDEISRGGLRPGDELIWSESQQPTQRVADALHLIEGGRVHAMQRLRRANGEAMAIETTYFPADLTPGLLDVPLTGSIWAILRDRYGIVASRASASFEVVALEAVIARRLSTRNAAGGILLTRRTFDPKGRCFEFARDVYRADRVELLVDTPVDPLGPEIS